MNTRTLVRAAVPILALGGVLLSGTVHADQALIVGVNTYPNLRPGSNLGGCVNDANRMAETLKKYNFKVTILTDGEATKQAILAALNKMRSNSPTERIAFYFAGHGTHGSNGESVFLPSNASDASEANDVQTEELFQAMKAVPARSRTVILDSCHSGGMMRAYRSVVGLKARYYQRSSVLAKLKRQGKAFEEVPANNQDEPGKDMPGGGTASEGSICYYAACLKNEVSNEKAMPNGDRDGVFTYRLTEQLKGQRDIWQDLNAAVTKSVADDTDDLQHPALTPAYLPKVVFDLKDGNDKSNTLADIYNTTNPNEDMVSLKMYPGVGPLVQGQKVYFSVKANSEGYLVLLGRDPGDEIYMIYPRQGGVEDAQVSSGTTVRIPKDPTKMMASNTPGSERVKAILFTSKEVADKMISAMKAAGADRGGKRKKILRKFAEVPAGDNAAFYTSEFTVVIAKKEGNQ